MATRLLGESWVSPPKDSVPETKIPLSFLDVLWQLAGSVERLFFFKTPNSTCDFIHHVIPRLKSSLVLTLQHWYPLAGHCRYIPDSNHKFEYHYKDGDAVQFTVAESDDDFDQLSGNHERDYARLQPLIPNLVMDLKKTPLMALQVTLFPGYGICIGVAIHHAMCDGTSYMNFIKSWAATCRLEATAAVVAGPPSFDRKALADPGNLSSVFVDAVVKLVDYADHISSQATTQEDVVFSTFMLRREELEKLRQRILAQFEQGKAPFHCSTFVTACAYVWTCLIRARGWPSDRIAHMGFAVDARARLSPPIPYEYFGNCIGFCVTEVKVSDVVEEGVGSAAEAIGRAIERVKKEGVLEGADEWPQVLERLATQQPLSIAGSPRLRVYETDFGWGRPSKVDVTSIMKTGAISLAEAKIEQGGQGGIEIALALPRTHMDEFTSHFSTAFRLLLSSEQIVDEL